MAMRRKCMEEVDVIYDMNQQLETAGANPAEQAALKLNQ